MRPHHTLAASALASFVWVSGALAQPTAAVQAEAPVRLEPVTVWGYSAPGILDRVPGRLQWSVPASLATALEAEPSLALYHSGAATPDPLLRGLGSDRVVTAIDGLPLFGASPTRTASPLALISGGLPSGLELVKSLPSVTLGPPANGDRKSVV